MSRGDPPLSSAAALPAVDGAGSTCWCWRGPAIGPTASTCAGGRVPVGGPSELWGGVGAPDGSQSSQAVSQRLTCGKLGRCFPSLILILICPTGTSSLRCPRFLSSQQPVPRAPQRRG